MEHKLEKANELFENYSFEKALEKYDELKIKTIEVYRKMALCHLKLNDIENAENYFAKIVLDSTLKVEDIYHYAFVLLENKKYDEAQKWMLKFNQLAPNDSRGIEFNEKIDLLSELQNNKHEVKISNLLFNDENEDFCPVFYDSNKVIFVSSRESHLTVKRNWNWNGLPFLDLYVATINNLNEFINITPFSDELNGKYHDGPVSFNSDQNLMVFTRNNYFDKSEDGVHKLKLYYKTKSNEIWSNEQEFLFDDNEYSVGHSSISADGNLIYFASDMPGGFGGVDLYVIEKINDSIWSKPKNLGDVINTEGNEMFPYIHASGRFFFSSDGHFGLGGLDIFEISFKNNPKLRNLGFPINSSRDDFGISLSEPLSKGYISSNRSGGKGDDDIYFIQNLNKLFNESVESIPIAKDTTDKTKSDTLTTIISIDTISKHIIPMDAVQLSGYTKDENNNVIAYAKIEIQPSNDSSSIHIVTSDKDGYYEDYLAKETEYSIKVFDENNQLKNLSYIVTSQDSLLKANLTINELKLTGNIMVEPIYFDLNKDEIRKDAALTLDKIVKIMNQNPNMVIELGSHTDCRASKSYNLNLSNKRAISSAKYIKSAISNPLRISGKGYGESNLINECECEGSFKIPCTEDQHQENRRTEFKIIQY